MYYVYELWDLYGNCVWVGETQNTERRFRQHTIWKSGKFYQRHVTMYIVDSFTERRSALDLEKELKAQYSIEHIESTRALHMSAKRGNTWKNNVIVAASENGYKQSQTDHVCPHCNKPGKGNGMKRWHFNNCKYK